MIAATKSISLSIIKTQVLSTTAPPRLIELSVRRMSVNMATASSIWPINYPAVVNLPFNPSAYFLSRGFLRVNVGDEVQVRSKEDGFQNVCIRYPKDQKGRPGRIGYVPIRILVIGNTRRVGSPLAVDIGEPPRLASTLVLGQGELLEKTVSGLLSSYLNNRAELPREPLYVSAKLGDPQRLIDFKNRILSGIHEIRNGTLFDVLNSGDFDVYDILKNSEDASNSTKRGIYGILYDKYPDSRRRPELYIGSTTTSFSSRYSEHVTARNASVVKGKHYPSAKAAGRHRIFPICIMHNLDPDGHDNRIAEQIILDLFQTTCEAVLIFTDVSVIDDEAGNEENPASNPPPSDAEKIDRVARYHSDKEAAKTLMELADQVFQRTGWPGGVRRTTGKDFGARRGLNWKMPLLERMFARTQWVKTEKPGQIANFRRTGLVAHNDRGRKRLWVKSCQGGGAADYYFFFLNSSQAGPAFGTPIHIVFEIMLDGSAHAVQLGLMPTTGCYSDWKEATGVGMRIEWQDQNGQWLHMYNQLESYDHIVPGGPDGAVTGYSVASGIRAYLLQQDRPPTQQYPWLHDFGKARVKEVYIDHLTQTVRTRHVVSNTPAPPLRTLTMDEMADEVEALGAGRATRSTDTSYPIMPGGVTRLNDSKWTAKGTIGR